MIFFRDRNIKAGKDKAHERMTEVVLSFLSKGKPKGIFTSQDVLNRVAIKNIKTKKLRLKRL
jgi:hypothetical protein